MRYMPAAFTVALLAFFLMGCERESDDSLQYEVLPEASEYGIGRAFMGREIARVYDPAEAELLDRPAREIQEMPERVLQALPLTDSSIVADIGAGTGYFAIRIAERVPEGRVLAVDIQPEMLDVIRERAAARDVENVELILGEIDDPKLPEAAIDVALIVDAYHEFSHPREMMDQIRKSLRPDGRLILVVFRGEDDTIPLPATRRITEEQLKREMNALGLEWRETRDMLPQQHYMVFGVE